MRVLAFLLALAGGSAFAANNTTSNNFTNTTMIQAITNAGASSNHTTTDATDSAVLGKAMNAEYRRYLSFQCNWASLTGGINATMSLEVSNDNATWTAKTSALYTLSGANGNQDVSLTNATERYYRLVYTAGTVSGGTINCFVVAKD